MSELQIFKVGARHADGTTSLWDAPAESFTDAKMQVASNILQHDPFKPAQSVLVCIPGGKHAPV